MRKQLPISTAPQDGRTVTILWTDFDGQINDLLHAIVSFPSYRKLVATGMKMTAAGGFLSTAPHRKKSPQTPGLKTRMMRLRTNKAP